MTRKKSPAPRRSPDFYPQVSSQVFRPTKPYAYVDLEDFYGSIEHEKLLAVLSMRIKDEVFLSLVAQFLKNGHLVGGIGRKRLVGIPQGSIKESPSWQTFTLIIASTNGLRRDSRVENLKE